MYSISRATMISIELIFYILLNAAMLIKYDGLFSYAFCKV